MIKKIFLLLMFGIMVVGCAKRQTVKPVESAPPAAQEPISAGQSSRHTDWQSAQELATVYFDYDKSSLLSDARKTLKTNAQYLKAHTDLNVLVEGNCDERGTIEYNLALGDRRASTVLKYYTKLGISKKRIAVISYGKEKPVDPGHDEAAWQKNRRVETKVRNANVENSIPVETH